MVTKFYTIKVGQAEPQLVLRGEVNKKNGNPMGKVETGYAVSGGTAIPNFSVIWGCPVIKEGKRTGEFTPMKWGTIGGQAMEIRYMPACPSLDKAYQIEVGLKARDEDAEFFLDVGINEFDIAVHPKKVEMLKLHTFNGDSPCRNPENPTIIYNEYDEAAHTTLAMKEDEILYEAMGAVIEAKDNPDRLRVLATIFGIPHDRKDRLISTELMARLKANPLKFNEDKNNYLKLCQKVLIKARDFQLLDMTIPGEIRAVGDEIPLIEDLPNNMNGNRKLDYLLENMSEPIVFAAMQRIKTMVEKKEATFN
jgi:hypothetical protein